MSLVQAYILGAVTVGAIVVTVSWMLWPPVRCEDCRTNMDEPDTLEVPNWVTYSQRTVS
jgi:hypothetical protein